MPRGIDRVDLCYARYLFENWAGDCGGHLPAAWVFDLRSAGVLQLLDRVEELLSETVQPRADQKMAFGKPEPETISPRRLAFRFSSIQVPGSCFGHGVLVWHFRSENRANEFHLS